MRLIKTGEAHDVPCECGATLIVTSLPAFRFRLQHGPNQEAVREFETPGWIRADDPDVVAWLADLHRHEWLGGDIAPLDGILARERRRV